MYKCREIAEAYTAYKYELIAKSSRCGSSCARRFENISREKESRERRQRAANFYVDFRECNSNEKKRTEPEWEIVFCFHVPQYFARFSNFKFHTNAYRFTIWSVCTFLTSGNVLCFFDEIQISS